MMNASGKIVLCADSESLMNPWMMGLDGIDVESFEWLTSFSQAGEARKFITSISAIDEVWVVSSNDIESVNLAAAIRKDHVELPITLILTNLSGSILSKASSAGIKVILTAHEFAERFAVEVQRRRRLGEAGSLGYEEVITTIRKGSSRRRKLNVPEIDVAKTDAMKDDRQKTAQMEQPIHIEKELSELPGAVSTIAKKDSNNGTDSAGSADVTGSTDKNIIRDKNAFVMGIFSGSGGVGKSVVAALAGCICAQKGIKTLLIDADLQFGDLAVLLGKRDAPTVDDVLEDLTVIESLSQKSAMGAPTLIAAPKKLESSESLDRHIGDLLFECVKFFDVVIVNTGSCWQEGHAILLENSDCSVFLMDQRASSVRANSHALDLCQRMGIATSNFIYALNHCEKKSLFSVFDIAGVMNGAHIYELKDGGYEIEESCGAGCTGELIDSNNAFVTSLKAMLIDLLPDSKRLKSANETRQGSEMSSAKHHKEGKDHSQGQSKDRSKDQSSLRSLFFWKGKESRRRSSFKSNSKLMSSNEMQAEMKIK